MKRQNHNNMYISSQAFTQFSVCKNTVLGNASQSCTYLWWFWCEPQTQNGKKINDKIWNFSSCSQLLAGKPCVVANPSLLWLKAKLIWLYKPLRLLLGHTALWTPCCQAFRSRFFIFIQALISHNCVWLACKTLKQNVRSSEPKVCMWLHSDRKSFIQCPL